MRARWNITFPVQVEWLRRGDIDTGIPKEVWKVAFQVTAVLLFKVSASGIEDVQILNMGKPTQIIGQVEGLYKSDITRLTCQFYIQSVRTRADST